MSIYGQTKIKSKENLSAMLNSDQINENKEKFKSLLMEAAQLKPEKQKGIERLLDYLEQTDFYTAPASTKYHQNYEGGLVEHTLNVFKHLEKLVSNYGFDSLEETDPNFISRFDIIMSSLLHDLCKVNFYEKYTQGHYLKDAYGKDVLDKNGRKQWVEDEAFRVKQNVLEMGHAMKSLFMINHFILLSEKISEAIANHMGPYDTSDYHTVSNISNAFNHNKLAYLLHIADLNDLYIREI